MPQLWNHRSASFLKSSLSSMTRTRVMSPGKEGGMRILCKAPGTIHTNEEPPRAGLPWPSFAGVSAGTEAGTQKLVGSVERKCIPGDAVPGDAVPRDAVPRDAVPGEVVPGGAIPEQGIPGEQRPENTARQRIVPLQGRAKKDRVQRTGEPV